MSLQLLLQRLWLRLRLQLRLRLLQLRRLRKAYAPFGISSHNK
jgi:hypothetical protein